MKKRRSMRRASNAENQSRVREQPNERRSHRVRCVLPATRIVKQWNSREPALRRVSQTLPTLEAVFPRNHHWRRQSKLGVADPGLRQLPGRVVFLIR